MILYIHSPTNTKRVSSLLLSHPLYRLKSKQNLRLKETKELSKVTELVLRPEPGAPLPHYHRTSMFNLYLHIVTWGSRMYQAPDTCTTPVSSHFCPHGKEHTSSLWSGAAETASWLRACAALPEDPGPVPSTRIQSLVASLSICTHVYINYTQIYTHD